MTPFCIFFKFYIWQNNLRSNLIQSCSDCVSARPCRVLVTPACHVAPSPAVTFGDTDGVRAYLCTGWGPGNRDTELHSMGAGGGQAENRQRWKVTRACMWCRSGWGVGPGGQISRPPLAGRWGVLGTIADTGHRCQRRFPQQCSSNRGLV